MVHVSATYPAKAKSLERYAIKPITTAFSFRETTRKERVSGPDERVDGRLLISSAYYLLHPKMLNITGKADTKTAIIGTGT